MWPMRNAEMLRESIIRNNRPALRMLLRSAPSPGTPGEGWGEGLRSGQIEQFENENSKRPSP
jgi:hypothetical protein